MKNNISTIAYPMDGFYNGLAPEDKRDLCRRVIHELATLLNLEIFEPICFYLDFMEFIEATEKEIISAIDKLPSSEERNAVNSLIALWADSKHQPVTQCVHSLAEILFLSRENRIEYLTNKELTPPYKIGKLLLEYATKSRRLDYVLGVLTKDYCATHCQKLPVGCCYILGYDLGLVPDVMLKAQQLEALRTGWSMPNSEEKCRYHTTSGCRLALFKSPACIGYLCEELVTELQKRFPVADVDKFLTDLAIFRNCDLDRVEVFRAMDALQESGAKLTGLCQDC